MARCWCGIDHSTIAQRGGIQNGPIKHWVWNWKLYEIRKYDRGEEPGEEKQQAHAR